MNIKKYIVPVCLALLGLGFSSCIGDLNLEPNDPNLVNGDSPNFNENSLGICYMGIACSGISGPESSYVSDLDPGTSAYLRLIFMLSEFCADEMLWIWNSDAGIPDITACTWSAANGVLNGVYYRLLGHIAICNQFLANTAGSSDSQTQEMRAEARVLRAYSYYNMLDLFGQSSFTTEETLGEKPIQVSRTQLFSWLEEELKEIVDKKLISEKPLYGRVGLDGAEALLARLYLNAEVFSGEARWGDCQTRCENIIARHQGGGFQGSGLANHYLYLFSRDNGSYMPGGDKPQENEILFGIAFDSEMTQSYGGPSFIISGTTANTHYIVPASYGAGDPWSCIRGCQQMAQRFDPESGDVRDDLWLRGVLPAGKKNGVEWPEEDYSDHFAGFTGAWETTGGNAIIKFTGRTRNAAQDGGWDMTSKYNELLDQDDWTYGFPATKFASTDQPIIRLADIYLMYTECYLSGGVGDRTKALNYFNLIRNRANAGEISATEFNIKTLLDERSREFYLESVRRADLIRNKMFTGPSQTVWQYKGNINNNTGTRIAERYNLYPIPTNVLAAQPEFKQNPGY